MIKQTKFIFIFCLFFFISHIAFSQQKDTATRAEDSLHEIFLAEQSKQLRELDSVRVQDSIKRLQLEQQISQLKTTDNVKKQELQKELNEMKTREAVKVALKKQKIDSLRAFVKGYPVAPFFHDTLFSIYTKRGSLSAQERAAAITTRIKNLADTYRFNPDSLQIVAGDNSYDIVFGEIIVISISENDALWKNTNNQNLATEYKNIIGNAIIQYKKATDWKTLLKEFLLAALVLAVVVALIFIINKLFRFIRSKIAAHKARLFKGIKIRNYQLLDDSQQIRFSLIILNILKWIVIIVTIYFALPILFSIFPWTKGFADTLIAYFLDPIKKIFLAIWNYLPNFFTILVIVIVFRYFLKFVYFLKNEIEKGRLTLPGFYPDWANPTFQIIRILTFAFMLIVIFPYLPGSDSPVFKGVSVFLGVLFTFGSTGSLSNIIAGLVLTYMRAFKIGDRVKMGDVTGDVIEKTLLVTRIRTTKNEVISLSNSNVITSNTINYSSDAEEKGLILHTTVTIGYDVPWRDIHAALINAALKTEFILTEPKPFVLQTSLDDFYVSYQINAYTREANKQANIYSVLHQNIQDCCNEAGIEIMSPHYYAARDGNQTTIPNDYLPSDYMSPGFKIDNNNTSTDK